MFVQFCNFVQSGLSLCVKTNFFFCGKYFREQFIIFTIRILIVANSEKVKKMCFLINKSYYTV